MTQRMQEAVGLKPAAGPVDIPVPEKTAKP